MIQLLLLLARFSRKPANAILMQAAVLRTAMRERKAAAVAEITGRADVAEVPQAELEARMKDVTAAVRSLLILLHMCTNAASQSSVRMQPRQLFSGRDSMHVQVGWGTHRWRDCSGESQSS